jgi:hypothetical protein
VPNFVSGKLVDRQAFDGGLAIFSVHQVEQATSNRQALPASQQGRELFFQHLSKLFELIQVALALNIVAQNRLNDRMARQALLNKLVHHAFKLLQDALLQVGLLSKERLKSDVLVTGFVEEILQQQEVVPIEADHHLHALLVVALAVDVLDDFRGERVDDQFLDLARQLLSKEGFLVFSRCEHKHLRGQVVAVFLRGKVHELIFYLVDDCFSLRAIAVLEEGLQDTAPVVLVE